MELKLSLRPATTEDIPNILAIENKVHVAPWNEGHFLSELTKPYSQFLVMTDDETDELITGYVVFWILFDECQILNIAVDLPYRGLGIAKQMVRKAAALAFKKGIKKVVLDVRKSNMAAVQLYQGMNFSITHIRKGFYTNGEDAYQMTLNLDSVTGEF
jgi:ribosomal-protein-alanine N-acetyltransferase